MSLMIVGRTKMHIATKKNPYDCKTKRQSRAISVQYLSNVNSGTTPQIYILFSYRLMKQYQHSHHSHIRLTLLF